MNSRAMLDRGAEEAHKNKYDAIGMELRLSIALRYLAGGSYLDICFLHGVGISSFHAIVNNAVELLDKVLDNLKGPQPSRDPRGRGDVQRHCSRLPGSRRPRTAAARR